MNDNIVADTSFYVCYECDINRRRYLSEFFGCYSFSIGNKILIELPESLVKCELFNSNVFIYEEDFFEIVKPFFGRNECHKEDGEYEAIGIAYHLCHNYNLKYLVLDERRARKFVERYFPELTSSLTGTIGFIYNSCNDKKIAYSSAIEILNEIRLAVEKSLMEDNKQRPCSMDEAAYRKILIPLIEQLTVNHE